MAQALLKRFDRVFSQIQAAASASGREAGEVRLVAVSKWQGPDKMARIARHWLATGQAVFGESYVQEALEKIPVVEGWLRKSGTDALPEWHFIGHVQSRKAKDIVGRFSLIHSVDSEKLARALNKAWHDYVAGKPVGLAEARPSPQAVLLQVNIGREPQKGGVLPEELEELCRSVQALPGLQVAGLMCLPPATASSEDARPYFALLRQLRDSLRVSCGLPLPHLSMGMSSDFVVAIEEGATIVRVGTDIFGPRGG